MYFAKIISLEALTFVLFANGNNFLITQRLFKWNVTR